MTVNTRPFSYHYTAHSQEGDDQLRKRYRLPPSADISDDLRQAPLREQKAAMRVSLLLGICNLLAFGAGLSVMLIQPAAWTFPLGLILGMLGLAGMLAMPAIYRKIVEKKRRGTEMALGKNPSPCRSPWTRCALNAPSGT